MASALRISDPLPAARHQGATPWRGINAVSALTIYLVLLFALPSSATIGVLGSLGRPSLLWGLVLLVWWVLAKIQDTSTGGALRIRQPVRFAFMALLVVALVSFAVAMLRGQPEDQVSPAFTALIRLLSWAGVLLITLDGVRTMSDLVRLVRRIGIGAGLLAALGLAQFVTKDPLIGFFASIPGLTMEDVGFAERGGVARVPATAIHPLEYATALNAALPLVIAAAISGGFLWQRARHRFVWWIPVGLISVSALTGVSRSAIIGFAVAVVTMIPALPRRYRAVAILGGGVLAFATVLVVPGLLSTTLNLFAGASDDPSTQSRTGGLDRAPDFIAASPLVGAGFGTFLPRYYIFDNAWVLMAVEVGLLGVLAFAGLFAAAIWSAFTARMRSTDRDTRLLGYALSAAMVNIAVLFAFFDGMSFPMSGGILVLLAGMCAAIRTIAATEAGSVVPRLEARRLMQASSDGPPVLSHRSAAARGRRDASPSHPNGREPTGPARLPKPRG